MKQSHYYSKNNIKSLEKVKQIPKSFDGMSIVDPKQKRVSDLKWDDDDGNEVIAENDHQKAEALLKYFSSVYVTDDDEVFEDSDTGVSDSFICMPEFNLCEQDVRIKLQKN